MKQAFAVGRDLESMSGDLSRWMQCASDIKNAQEYSKNPPFYKKLLSGDSIEKLAVESLMATKAIETQRYDLQQFIKYKYGTQAWEDLLRLEGKIRKDRAKAILERQRQRDAIIQYALLVVVVIVGCYILYAFIQYLLYLDGG